MRVLDDKLWLFVVAVVLGGGSAILKRVLAYSLIYMYIMYIVNDSIMMSELMYYLPSSQAECQCIRFFCNS